MIWKWQILVNGRDGTGGILKCLGFFFNPVLDLYEHYIRYINKRSLTILAHGYHNYIESRDTLHSLYWEYGKTLYMIDNLGDIYIRLGKILVALCSSVCCYFIFMNSENLLAEITYKYIIFGVSAHFPPPLSLGVISGVGRHFDRGYGGRNHDQRLRDSSRQHFDEHGHLEDLPEQHQTRSWFRRAGKEDC